jgi:hypothetical protein
LCVGPHFDFQVAMPKVDHRISARLRDRLGLIHPDCFRSAWTRRAQSTRKKCGRRSSLLRQHIPPVLIGLGLFPKNASHRIVVGPTKARKFGANVGVPSGEGWDRQVCASGQLGIKALTHNSRTSGKFPLRSGASLPSDRHYGSRGFVGLRAGAYGNVGSLGALDAGASILCVNAA